MKITLADGAWEKGDQMNLVRFIEETKVRCPTADQIGLSGSTLNETNFDVSFSFPIFQREVLLLKRRRRPSEKICSVCLESREESPL